MSSTAEIPNDVCKQLIDVVSEELRELSQSLCQDARRELQRLVDDHAERLEKYLQRQPTSPSGPFLTPPRHRLSAWSGLESERLSREGSQDTRSFGDMPGAIDDVPVRKQFSARPRRPNRREGSGGYKDDSDAPESPVESPLQAKQAWDDKADKKDSAEGRMGSMPKMIIKSVTKIFNKEEKGRSKSSSETVMHHQAAMMDSLKHAVEYSNAKVRYRNTPSREASDELADRFKFSRLVRSEYFDYIMGAFLLVNALTIGLQADLMARSSTSTIPLGYRLINAFFCILFSAELTVRIIAYGCADFFCSAGWQWNWFDSCIVAFTIVDELAQVFITDPNVKDAIDSLGVLRMLRLGRIARLVRMVHLIPSLHSMVCLIMASMGSFFWTVMLILIMLYCLAIYFTELATDIRIDGSAKEVHVVELHWGSLGNSILSLFMAISGGDDWRNLVEPFKSDSMYIINTLLFSAYIALATLVMLNLVTGVFVEGAQRIIKEEKKAELLKVASNIFLNNRLNFETMLDEEEFDDMISAEAFTEFFEAVGMSEDEAFKFFRSYDTDENGAVHLAQFVTGCLLLGKPSTSGDLVNMQYNQKEHARELSDALVRVESSLRRAMSILIEQDTILSQSVGIEV